MTTAPESRSLRQALLLPLAGVVFFVIYGFVFMHQPEQSQWYSCFVRAARALRAGEPIHGEGYMYPPAMAMLAVPWAGLSPAVSLFIWYLVNIVATIAAFVCVWQLAGGPSLRRPLPPPWPAIWLLGFALAARFFVAPLENQQFDMVIAALLFVGCRRLWRGHEISGAVCLGLAAAMKGPPLLFAPYLAWRGYRRAAAVLVTVAVLLNLMPDVLWPQANGRLYLADWYFNCLSSGQWAAGHWFTDVLLNQSLAGFFNRLLRFGLPLSSQVLEARPAIAPTHGSWAAVLSYSTGALLLALSAWRFRKPAALVARPAAAERAPRAFGEIRLGIEAGAVVCLMLLLSPQSSKAHYVVVLLPAFIIARLVVERWNLWLGALLTGLLITGPLTAKGVIGKALGDLTLAWGLPAWFALLSLAGMWVAVGVQREERCSR
ncbi:MAG: DUF2029 domain-containing protein [Deltaproteobacteria bacterium]|nr:DUF2029 domain-containing protein [Deltaproteobacteria bacterium]